MENQKYMIIEEDNLFYLTDKVNEFIDQGWKPTGGIFVFKNYGVTNSYPKYLQAMEKC